MVKLRDLLAKVPNIGQVNPHQSLDSEVKGISTNSYSCQQGDVFIGMPGTQVDGGQFWQSALESGAIAAIISPEAAAQFPPTSASCVITVEDMSTVLAQLATAFYNYPSQQLKMIGVTGTNGKTT
ncbi:MAG TPA: UDP-N-acetylmuramoyl-L-alanyl-D-glutamate--2,6-diaminopimelate ligase, partial [Cyanothece sp. UBA12306]|nr:UDP-N-acetylmuramoyl-L-alanyl-D-glutamate--2,6-diaminopimelate ligase [Cyanothece sp. UBA12306]